MYFTIKAFIYFLLLQSHTLIHELGHVIAIHIPKHILIRCKHKLRMKIKMPTHLKTKICFIGNGRTESLLYEYIKIIKCEPLIMFNTISGMLFEIIIYLFIVIISFYLYKKSNCLLYSNLMIVFTLLSLRDLLSCCERNNNDITYFKYPEKYEYEYNYDFKSISLNDFKTLFKSSTTYIYTTLLYVLIYALKRITRNAQVFTTRCILISCIILDVIIAKVIAYYWCKYRHKHM